MTLAEKRAASALLQCTFIPGSFDKRWVNQLDNWADRELTKEGKAMLFKTVKKYRRQIPNWVEIQAGLSSPKAASSASSAASPL